MSPLVFIGAVMGRALAHVSGRFAVLAAAFLLTACATVQNSLSTKEIEAIRIAEVDVKVTPATKIWWGNAERDFVAKVKSGETIVADLPVKKAAYGPETDDSTEEYNRIISSPEAKQYLRDRLRGLIEQRLQSSIVPQYQGTRDVRLEVQVVSFKIPSAVQRIAFGGMPNMGSVSVLRDMATGQELAKSDMPAVSYAGQGITGVLVDQMFSDLEDRVMNKYINQVRLWLNG